MQSPSQHWLESRTLSNDVAILAARAMPPEEHPAAIHQSEFDVLRALCGDALSPLEREVLLVSLEGYEWKDEEHRVVFLAILGLGRADAATLRGLLPAAATRMGFPDIFWEDYFAADAGEKIEIQEKLRNLGNA